MYPFLEKAEKINVFYLRKIIKSTDISISNNVKDDFFMKIIASDFDGTLYRNEKITDRDKNAIFEWQKRGNKFGIVTGRGSDILKILTEHGIKLDYAISYNGAVVFDSDGKILFDDCFTKGMTKEVYDFIDTTDFKLLGERDKIDDINDSRRECQIYLRLKDEDEAKKLTDMLNEKFAGRLTSYPNGHWINTVKYGVSKATGIAHYAEIIGIDKEDIYTVGDCHNDLPMLQAFKGHVVESGHPDMLKIIPNVCKDIAHLTELAYKE